MRAAVLREYGAPLSVEEVPPPDAEDGGVVVEVEACGICRSDWHAWQGHGEWANDRVPLGQVLGHEPAGRVVEVGADVSEFEVGDRVAIPFNLGDGCCHQCVNGHGNVCEDGYALGFEESAPGAFAERVHVPAADYNAVALPPDVSAAAVAALGCRYATAYHALAHRAAVGAGDLLAVHGCGGLGLAVVQLGRALGASVVAVDVRQEPLSFATDLGATWTVRADEVPEVPDAVRTLTDGGVHVSVDALGRAETCRNSVASLRPRGIHVQLGLTTDAERGEVALPVDELTRWDVSFLGARGMPPTRYDELLRFVDGGRVDPTKLVTREVELTAVGDRLAAMSEYGTVGVEVVTTF